MERLDDLLRALDPRQVDWPRLAERLGTQPAAWPLIAGGAALILFGRRLYWLALGGLGAAVAVLLAGHLVDLPTPEGRLVVALVAAVVGALVAVFAQHLVVSAVGLLTGVALGAWATPLLWPDPGAWLLLVVALTGLVGLLLARRLFEGLLILATSASGAWLIVEALQVDAGRAVIAGVLVVIGVVAQSRPRTKRRPRRDADD